MARRWNMLQCSDSDRDGRDGTAIAIAHRWRAMAQRWRAMAQRWNNDRDDAAMGQRQRWNSDSEGSGGDSDSDGSDSDGSDSDGAPIERWRNDGTNVAMTSMVPVLRWRSDGQRCDESDGDCQRCDGQASATAAMGDIALRLDGDEVSASMAMVHGERC
ncbi:hypothetical protein CBR_g46007 [Chara braunii]|uniref:Uncharacterized protein n=1 Tax=Chara braunii TaxID=69332 RepID=A0A388LZZ7_CHABU|nr:hypothetical protein CBR_g46007 [Chara braunii]|eukprot:GBG87851.1 hypothetical protein CBR_g46007 [Chara braunii]